ncbi:MAG: hypothetical protein LBS16_01195 [Prevotellaceae bacterium]|jgi:tetratricopeptide (TPR) repeat protein|nr:hypothetical protein [Prevotellaceae bacterium]
MTRYFLFFLINCLFIVSATSQQQKDAERFFNAAQYQEALVAYRLMLKKSPASAPLHCRIGQCLLALKHYEEASVHLQYAADKQTPKASYYLAQAHFYNYHFGEAVEAFEAYLNESNDSTILLELKQARLGRDMLEHVDPVQFIDSMIIDKAAFLTAYRLNVDLGALKQMHKTSPVCDALVEFFSGRGDRRIFPVEINGQTDLMQSDSLLDGWTDPIRLPDEINSAQCENYPFVLSDGVTLYFGSTSEKGLGGYDIFFSRMNSSGRYLTPQHAPMPFNSPYNDYLMVIDDIAQIGWFATDRYQPAGKVAVYQFIVKEKREPVNTEDEQYLRDCAQLKNIRLLPKHTETITTALPKIEQASPIVFIVNDTLIYYALTDFHSIDAREIYIAMTDSVQQSTYLHLLLDRQRTAFINATEDERALLRQSIPDLEKQILQLQKAIIDMELRLRRMETEARLQFLIRSGLLDAVSKVI